MEDKRYMVVGKNFAMKNPRAQYYCRPHGWVKHFWSFNDAHAVIVGNLQDARFTQQWAQNDDTAAIIVEFKEELRQDPKQEGLSFQDLMANAQRLGCEVIY